MKKAYLLHGFLLIHALTNKFKKAFISQHLKLLAYLRPNMVILRMFLGKKIFKTVNLRK